MSNPTDLVRTQDHTLGPKNAPAVLVEWGDFECPYCGKAHRVLQEILKETGSELLFVFRHFPLKQIHPHAESAALAAEAAGAQGKFWEMHDILYENQTSLEEEDLAAYAQALDLDMERFDDDVRTRKDLPRIQEDFMNGVRSGVNGTPTFFINGTRHDGSYEYPVLSRALRDAGVARAR